MKPRETKPERRVPLNMTEAQRKGCEAYQTTYGLPTLNAAIRQLLDMALELEANKPEACLRSLMAAKP